MANVTAVSAGGETLSLAGGGGTDDVYFTSSGYFAANDTVTGATGTANKIIYAGASPWAITFDASFTGIAGIEGILLETAGMVGITLQDAFLASNNLSGVFSVTANSAGGLFLDATALTGAYGIIALGSANADTLQGGAGQDVLQGGAGTDSLSAGAGNDTIVYASPAETTNDTIIGGAGTDLISFTTTGSYSLQSTNLSGFEQISASGDGSSISVHTTQLTGLISLSMVAGGSVDTLYLYNGGTVDFSTISVSGVDSIVSANSGAINATLSATGMKYIGSTTSDTVNGGAGNDTIEPQGSGDFIYGGGGNDLVIYNSLSHFTGDVIDGGTGIDTLSINATSGFDLTLATVTNFEVYQLAGDGSTVNMTAAKAATLQALQAIAGGAVDRIDISGGGSIDLSAGNLSGFDVIANSDNAALSIMLPQGGGFQYQGGTGTDDVLGGAGAETIFGGAGADTIDGQAGNDVVVGGAGADSLAGGNGHDLIFGGTDTIAADDTISGGLGNDTIDAGDGADSVSGGDGDDLIFAGSTGLGHADTLNGDSGNDTLVGNQTGTAAADVLFGGLGDDLIFGGYGSDALEGADGNDTLVAGTGNDSLTAGMGNDVMWGDGGADHFVFLSLDGIDTIVDFQIGIDKIDLTGRAFSDYSAFSLAVTRTVEANGLTLTFTDGAKIQLYGVSSLTASDFLFFPM